MPINPAGCGDRDGAAVEDISRSAGSYPAFDETGLKYSWEVLGGVTLTRQAALAAPATPTSGWSDRAILRAAEFLARNGGYARRRTASPAHTWMINNAYGTTSDPTNPAGYGRQFGFTDWLP